MDHLDVSSVFSRSRCSCPSSPSSVHEHTMAVSIFFVLGSVGTSAVRAATSSR